MTPPIGVLADALEELAGDGSTPFERAALVLIDALNRKNTGYHPDGWVDTGVYGSCPNCGEWLCGCGVLTAMGESLCPDCAGITKWPTWWAEVLATPDTPVHEHGADPCPGCVASVAPTETQGDPHE